MGFFGILLEKPQSLGFWIFRDFGNWDPKKSHPKATSDIRLQCQFLTKIFRGAFFHFLFFIIKLNLKSELTSLDEISPDFIKIVLF